MSDMPEFYFLPPLIALLDREARGIRIDVENIPVESVSAAMRAGEIDLVLGYVPGLDAGCVGQTLFLDEHVCAVRAGHPLRKAKPSREDLSALRYACASTNATGHRMVEQWLASSPQARCRAQAATFRRRAGNRDEHRSGRYFP